MQDDLEQRISLLEERLYEKENYNSSIENIVRKSENDTRKIIEQQGIDIAQEMALLERKIEVNNFGKEGVEKIEFGVNNWVKKFEIQLNVYFL